MSEGLTADQRSSRGLKSAHAFRTISEVASELSVPSHVLRFWETKFSQIRPLKRGGGRRYYRPEDVDLIRNIRSLLYDDGYTIKGVQKLLREGGTISVAYKPSKASPTTKVSTSASSQIENSAQGGMQKTDRAALSDLLRELEELRDILRTD